MASALPQDCAVVPTACDSASRLQTELVQDHEICDVFGGGSRPLFAPGFKKLIVNDMM